MWFELTTPAAGNSGGGRLGKSNLFGRVSSSTPSPSGMRTRTRVARQRRALAYDPVRYGRACDSRPCPCTREEGAPRNHAGARRRSAREGAWNVSSRATLHASDSADHVSRRHEPACRAAARMRAASPRMSSGCHTLPQLAQRLTAPAPCDTRATQRPARRQEAPSTPCASGTAANRNRHRRRKAFRSPCATGSAAE